LADRPTHGWCPSCKEESAIDNAGNCLWCGKATEQRPKRGGWKRPDLQGSRYTEAQLRALHLAHQRGASINSLAKRTFDKVGYKTPGSAATAIGREWKNMGLKARDRIEQTVLSSTKHGRGGRNRDEGAYRRWFKRTNGLYRPTCKGVRAQHPRKGEPCQRPAMEGSEFCSSHDPERRKTIKAHLSKMRASAPAREMVPMAPFAAWLQQRREELGSWSAVAEHVERTISLVHCYGRGLDSATKQPKDLIGRSTVEELLEADGTTTFDDLYAAEREAVAA
jgi:hypothetical protein